MLRAQLLQVIPSTIAVKVWSLVMFVFMAECLVWQISYNINDIHLAVSGFWQFANQYAVHCFEGPMGAGKTTFIRALCQHIGVVDMVTSPTFAIVNEYGAPTSPLTIYHMDWYRLNSVSEGIAAGVEDLLHPPDGLYFIEWPSQAVALLPKPHVWVAIDLLSTTERSLAAHVVAE